MHKDLFFFLLKISVSDIELLTCLLWLKINEHYIDTDVHAIHWNKAFVSCRCVCCIDWLIDCSFDWSHWVRLIVLGTVSVTLWTHPPQFMMGMVKRCTFLWHSFSFFIHSLLDVYQWSCFTLLNRAARTLESSLGPQHHKGALEGLKWWSTKWINQTLEWNNYIFQKMARPNREEKISLLSQNSDFKVKNVMLPHFEIKVRIFTWFQVFYFPFPGCAHKSVGKKEKPDHC